MVTKFLETCLQVLAEYGAAVILQSWPNLEASAGMSVS